MTVDNSADLNTSGDASYGIFAQSVGGGGGNAGDGTLDLEGWEATVSDISDYIEDA